MVEAVTSIFRCLPAVLGLLAVPSAAFAHQLDEYLQATLVSIEPGSVRLQINLTPGVAIAEQVLAVIDRDRDGAISANEVAAYAELLKRDLTLRLDGQNLEAKLIASQFPEPGELRTGWEIISMEFRGKSGPLTTGSHKFEFENRHLPVISGYLFNAAQPGSGSIQIIAQKRNQIQSAGEIDFIFHRSANTFRVFGFVAALALALFAGVWRTAKTSQRST